ncbi:hypothetical protein J7T55_008231 [Diaporthe amygdali]|uniref:uncharacterized protein n=1 Tax=Phomopsis amygdali TaxID=1214568 RepID=UPI0022FF2FDD|nr:uncharacterized protein J7T55_008231 [Diaporthe amygdali]KAJ0121071.1 hypothetical protein J7T55_008231 [Diaporthe amygdali]
MPHGSSGPPPIPTSNITNIDIASPPQHSPLAVQRFNSPIEHDATMKKTKVFGPASPTTARPRTGHQSIRGLRISGPIPMTNPIEDDEFPIRNPGTGIASATPLDSDPIPPPPPPQAIPTLASPVTQAFSPVAQSAPIRADIVDVPQTVPEHPGSPSPHPYSQQLGSSGPSPEGGASSGASAARSSPARYQRTNPSTTTRFSTISANSGKTGDTSHDVSNSPPQRKKSTLRSALSKFLRRKKKEGSLSSVSETDRQSALGGPSQHRSVPPAARLDSAQQNEPAKRVASMPVNEFDRALRSHSIGPDDITAIESARNSLSFDALGSSPNRRRAATATNSKLFLMMAPGPRSRGEEWAGLSPRPASTHARGSRFTEDDPEEIGRALTSDTGGESGHKRRSRSLSQLYEVAQEQKDARRRSRSDEIRFWRESYDVPGPLSPLSSNPNENETDIGNEDQYEHGRASMSVAESQMGDKVPKTPPQPFNFGTLSSMNEMAGMKITQAATLDERFGCLENRVYRLERVVSQLCHSVPGFKSPLMEVNNGAGSRGGRQRSGSGAASGSGLHQVPVNNPTYAYSNVVPPMIPSIYQTGSRDAGLAPSSRRSVDTTDDNTSHMSFGEGRTYIDSLHPPSSSATQNQSATGVPPPQAPALLRPTSESTVRPATSMPSLGPRASQSSSEDYPQNSAALVAQLENERAARYALEEQVRKLSERMNNLSSTMFAMVRDPAKSKSSERLRPQTATSAVASTNAAHLAPISVNTTKAAPTVDPSSKAQSIFGKDSRFSSVTNSPVVEVADDEFSEAFQTPREEPGATPGLQQYEPFGGVDEFGGIAQYPEEDEDEADLKRKKAARTLSLSQLTMGKGLPTRI